MTRYVIDPPTLLHLVANDVRVSPRHRIVAPNLIRAQALSLLLQADALVTVDPALARRAEDVVPLAPLDALTADPD